MLYKKGKLNQIVSWEIEVSNGAYRTITGQLNGKKTISAWTTCKPKNVGKSNATSAQEQAIKEANAKTTKKLGEGYVTSIDELSDKKASEQEVVMLAEHYKDFMNDIPEDEFIYVQPKLDGIRSRMIRNIEQVELISRKNKTFVSVPHIVEELQVLDSLLDGELYNHDLKEDFNAITSIVKKSKPTSDDLAESERIMQYHIYDVLSSDIFSKRYAYLQTLFEENKFKYLVLVPTYRIKKSEIDKYHKLFVSQGYEGIMIRRDTPYEFFRSTNLLKLKNLLDMECEIIDIEEGIGNRSKMMGRVKLKINNKYFYANAKGDRKFYKELLDNKKEYIGKLATIIFQNFTPDGIPRFARIVAIRDYE